MIVTVTHELRIDLAHVDIRNRSAIVRAIDRTMTIPNPARICAERAGRYADHIQPTLSFYRADTDALVMPRGYASELGSLGPVEWDDQRLVMPEIEYCFAGTLRGYQQRAIADILRGTQGVLQAGTGAGKTVMALAIIALRKQPTLVLVHNAELLHQWRDRAKQFLGVEAGQIGQGKLDVQPLTIGIVNSVRTRLPELTQRFGHVVVDECHRCPSAMFTECVNAFPAKYRLGLSATPYRRDGLDKVIGFYLGPKLHVVDHGLLREEGAILRPEIVAKKTGFRWAGNASERYQEMMTALTQDPARNALIAGDVKAELAREAGTVLLVSDRVGHLEALRLCLRALGEALVLLTGQTPRAHRAEIVGQIRAGEVKVLGSTVQLIGEGFDAPGFASLVMATPIKFSGRLIQVVGRILRPQAGKVPRVYDYLDPVGVLESSAKARARTYAQL